MSDDFSEAMDHRKDGVRVGLFMSKEFADEFRRGCKRRGYKQSSLVRIALEEQFLKKWRAEDEQKESA